MGKLKFSSPTRWRREMRMKRRKKCAQTAKCHTISVNVLKKLEKRIGRIEKWISFWETVDTGWRKTGGSG